MSYMFRTPAECRAERDLTLALEVLLNSRVWPKWIEVESEKTDDAAVAQKAMLKFTGLWTALNKAKIQVVAVMHIERIAGTNWVVHESTITVDDKTYTVSWGTQFYPIYAGSQYGSQGYGVSLTLRDAAESKAGFGPAETWMQPVCRAESPATAA